MKRNKKQFLDLTEIKMIGKLLFVEIFVKSGEVYLFTYINIIRQIISDREVIKSAFQK